MSLELKFNEDRKANTPNAQRRLDLKNIAMSGVVKMKRVEFRRGSKAI